jgi:toluene monooxygenase system ferredoxin subunit
MPRPWVRPRSELSSVDRRKERLSVGGMALTKVCAASDLAEGEMAAFFLEGWEVLVVRDRHGALYALDGICPHEDTPLVHGDFDGNVLTCLNHFWSFDVTSGRGINPPTCRLAQYWVEARDDQIYVDRDRGVASSEAI